LKIHIGPYRSWIGPYQIANLLKYVGLKDEDKLDNIGKWLAGTWVSDVCNFVDKHKTRKISVKIDRYDTWSMDHTLAYIVLPMLKQLKADKHGAPLVDDDDVPTDLKSTSAPPKKNEWDTDENYFKRWDYVLNEMIWAFEQKLDDAEGRRLYYDEYAPDEAAEPYMINVLQEDGTVTQSEMLSADENRRAGKLNRAKMKEYMERKANGFWLFGKYFESLWD
jgi:hypothetical protein